MIIYCAILTATLIVSISAIYMQDRIYKRDMRFAAMNVLALATRLDASLSIASLFMSHVSEAEDTDRAQFDISDTDARELHRMYFYAMNGEPMTEEV